MSTGDARSLMPTLASKVVAVDRALAGIPHAFGGALALAYAVDEPRATADIDLNVFVAVDGVAEVFAVLPVEVGRGPDDLRAATQDGQVRLDWQGTPLDLFFNVHPFHEMVGRRTRLVPFADTEIAVLDPTDLVVFKAFFSRSKDWVDIESVIATHSADNDDALRWVQRLLGEDSPAFRRLTDLVANPGPGEDEHEQARRLGSFGLLP
jgi:hypothetical protein